MPRCQILAKEAAEEKDPEKLSEIVKALNDALDEQQKDKEGPKTKTA
jgi:ABC-type nitrate/sulfonate/bicarbonate transport system substrate-binding protein